MKKKKINLKPNDTLELILALVFICMLIITIFLGYKAVNLNKENKNKVKSSIVIPVLGKDTNSEISVDVANMSPGEEKYYSFKVSNSKDNNINQEEVLYAIQLTAPEEISMELYKNNGEENVLPENNILIENKLIADVEQEDIFTIKIKANKKTNDRELITVKVIS